MCADTSHSLSHTHTHTLLAESRGLELRATTVLRFKDEPAIPWRKGSVGLIKEFICQFLLFYDVFYSKNMHYQSKLKCVVAVQLQ